MNPTLQWTIAIGASYLIGAIPFGLLVGLARGIDVRTVGSGNIGATNVMRALGHPWGDICFALDVFKGLLPVVGFGWWLGVLGRPDPSVAQAWLWLAVAASCILGHIFPVYLRFKGGKGVATGFGALLGVWPHASIAALLALVVWIATLKTTRYVSLASCAAAISLPLVIVVGRLLGWPASDASPLERVLAGWPFLLLTGMLAVLVVARHTGNLRRIRAGTEHRVGEPKQDREDAGTPEKA
ncbi:MAG: glycerol-3-phosphate 1-O-acyltransferase PlsY [Planctomycetota bacterium]